MDKENMPVTTLYLNVTNSVQQNMLLVGLMAYVDDMMGLDLDNIAEQLEFTAKYVRAKSFEQKQRGGNGR